MRRWIVLAAAAVLLSPRLASAVTYEGYYGIARPPSSSFGTALDSAGNTPDLFDSSLHIAGGDILINLGGIEFGVVGDVNWGNGAPSQSAVGGLAGLRLDWGGVWIDLLGEAGAHRQGNIARDPLGVLTSSSANPWLAYVGLRPGIALVGGEPDSKVFFGIWTYVRWDVMNGKVPVTTMNLGKSGRYTLGRTSIGATLRFGFEF